MLNSYEKIVYMFKKSQKFTPSSCKNIRIRKLGFEASI